MRGWLEHEQANDTLYTQAQNIYYYTGDAHTHFTPFLLGKSREREKESCKWKKKKKLLAFNETAIWNYIFLCGIVVYLRLLLCDKHIFSDRNNLFCWSFFF